MMHISVGSNIDPAIHVPAAITRLREAFDVSAVSPFYLVPALDRPEQPDYWNGVVALQHAADDLPTALRNIEAAEGRVRSADKWAARTLDLDVLLDEGVVVDEDLHHRPFLARCLADLGALPSGIPEPVTAWPMAWDGQTED